ncbi:hypothetical protein MMC11_006205 [Xylographa trunciseda]|nr:hypothetical protein [Xylographa trunciseda]
MDGDQGHLSEDRKATSNSTISFSRTTPPEIRNMLYKYAALPNGVDPEERSLKTVMQDGTISPMNTVRSFFMDTVSEAGKSTLFAKEILQVTELPQEVLTLIFAETFAAHVSICNIVPELQVELDFTNNLSEEDIMKLRGWVECEQPHGRDIGMHDHVERWMRAIQLLPEDTNVYLVFSSIWRDFRELRSLSKKLELSKYTITFQFPTSSMGNLDNSFFEAQTMAAVSDIEVPEQVGISSTKRAELVRFGCRGFNSSRKYLAI